MEEIFSTFEIQHAQRRENRYADVLAALGSQIALEGSNTRVEVNKQRESIVEILQERFKEERCKGNWRIPIKESLMKEGNTVNLKT